MTFAEAFENDPQAQAEFHDYIDEMAEEHVHVQERERSEDEDRDEEWDEEDDGQPTEYEEWQDTWAAMIGIKASTTTLVIKVDNHPRV